jgi:hypothetical protein
VQKLHSLIACRNIVKDKFAGCSRSSPKLAAARRKAKQAVTSIRYAPSRPEGWHGSENVDLALHRRPSGCHLSQRGSDHLSPTSQDGLSDRVANCCNSTDGAHNLRQTGYFDLQHSIAIFAFFFRYFSSTRPNEFFQIQAYLIHWFRLLALLFSLFAAADGAFPVAVGPEPQDHARRCGAYRTAARPGNARLGSKPAVISALVSGPQSSDVSSAR